MWVYDHSWDCCAVVKDAITELVVTDLDDHLELMNKTLNANRHIIRVDKSHDGNKPFSIVRVHRWGEFDNEKREKFDFIFGSDLCDLCVRAFIPD